MYRVLDLFSGIGGFSLGLEVTGSFRTVAFCEIDKYCRQVLGRHWPGVPVYDDVRTLTADTLRRDGIAVDVIAGGFPCQDVSVAGSRTGIEGERSGLWSEYARLIGELRPRYAIVENVPGLLTGGMGKVLGDLAALGYDAVWDCIPACAVGAPHRRDRVWIVAHAGCGGGERARRAEDVARSTREDEGEGLQRQRSGNAARHRRETVADAHGGRQQVVGISEHRKLESARGDLPDGCRAPRRRSRPTVGHATSEGLPNSGRASVDDAQEEKQKPQRSGGCSRRSQHGPGENGSGKDVPDASEPRLPLPQQDALLGEGRGFERGAVAECGWWSSEPAVGRVAHGVPHRVDRLRALGNAVVPAVITLIGRAILEGEVTE